jgi:hypothetical protein
MDSPVTLHSFILFRVFLFPSTLCRTSLFFTRSVHTLFSVLLLHYILKICRYFLSIFRSVKLQHHKAMLPCLSQMKCNLLAKRILGSLKATFATATLDLISLVHDPLFVIMLPKRHISNTTFLIRRLSSIKYLFTQYLTTIVYLMSIYQLGLTQ